MKSAFTTRLLHWNSHQNRREMPWKGEKDPYKIWLSEIILQQTRVEQGLEYYKRFVHNFPTVHDLAKAPEQKVFKLWEGLGYCSRCKNLIVTAKIISNQLGGIFPDNYEDIKSLKGIGPYTASAIASFAFNLPYAVLDGNVYRILSRYFGLSTAIDNGEGKKMYAKIAEALLPVKTPGLYNQAIMDFGATVCKPKQPLCISCVQNKDCEAYRHGWINDLPIKEKVLQKKTRWFTYFLVEVDDKIYIRQRTAGDIWESLYEFVVRETTGPEYFNENAFKLMVNEMTGVKSGEIKFISDEIRQQLTHQTLYARFVIVKLKKPATALRDFQLVDKASLHQYAFPKLIAQFLEQNVKKQTLF